MITMKHIILLALAVLTSVAAMAQTTPGGEYYIQGIFNPTLVDAQKIDLRPEPIDTILPELPVRYEILGTKAEIPARVDSIAAAKLSVLAPQPKLYKGYVKGGFGLYTTPLGELYWNQTRSRNNAYGIHAKHLSSNGGVDDVGPSDYSFNSVDGHYTHYLPTHEVGGRLMYDRRRVSYYGYTATDSITDLIANTDAPEDALKQLYNDIGFAGRIRSLYKDSTRIAHDVGMEVHAYSNLTGSRETNVRIDADLAMQDGAETYGLGVLIDNNAYRARLGGVLGDVRQNGTLVGFTPQVSTRGDKYLVTVGAGIYVDALGKTTFHFFPKAYMSYSLFEDILVPYVGVDGARQRNSMRSLTRENPWLNGTPSLANSSLMYDIYGGLRGSFSRSLGFDVRISSSRMDDRALFVNLPNAPFGDRMGVLYDRVDVLNISGELRAHVRETFDLTARIDVSTYETRSQPEAWNLPPYQLAFGGVYSVREKLIVKAEAQFLGRRKVRGDEIVVTGQPAGILFETRELEGFMDLYLGLEYRYTKRLSIFLDASNLSASKYERWSQYPVQRSLVLGGATYAF
jgi:hypothetical protein